MPRLRIENKKIVLTVVLIDYFGKVELKDYLTYNLPSARCELVIGSSNPSSSFDEYHITIDAARELLLLRALKNFCKENDLIDTIALAD